MTSAVSVVRWIRDDRRLCSQEVDGAFDEARARLQVFAFATRRLAVEPHAGNFSLKVVLSGRERYTIDGDPVTLEPGSMLLVNGGERYASAIEDVPTTALACFLPDDAVARLPEIVPRPFRPSPALHQLTRALAAETWQAAQPDHAAVAALVDEVVALAVPECLRRFRPGSLGPLARRRRTERDLLVRVARARDYIDERRGRGVALNALAAVACVSKFHLLRAFTAAVGMTPAAYARECRLRHARERLQRGHEVRATARLLGYASPSTLNRALRRSAPPVTPPD
jgi:AraC-like DNA-binding protein